MGNDAPLACMAAQPRLVYEYFRQLFAQVTNPPIDPIRENIVMSLEAYIGPESNLLEMKASQCHRIALKSPIISIEEMNVLKQVKAAYPRWESRTIETRIQQRCVHDFDQYWCVAGGPSGPADGHADETRTRYCS